MPPKPDWCLGSIFSFNPRYLSNCPVGASVFLSPAGVQLSWAPRPSEGVFASVRKAEKQKSPPALSRLRPAICRAISELTSAPELRFLFPQLPLRVTFRIVEKRDWSVSGEGADPDGTAMSGQPVTEPEQAPELHPLTKISLISKRTHGSRIRY